MVLIAIIDVLRRVRQYPVANMHPTQLRRIRPAAEIMLNAFADASGHVQSRLARGDMRTLKYIRDRSVELCALWLQQKWPAEWRVLLAQLHLGLIHQSDWETCLGKYPDKFDLPADWLWVVATYDYAYGAHSSREHTTVFENYTGHPLPPNRFGFVVEPIFHRGASENRDDADLVYAGAVYRSAGPLDISDITEGVIHELP